MEKVIIDQINMRLNIENEKWVKFLAGNETRVNSDRRNQKIIQRKVNQSKYDLIN